jgi:hypothetical protein
LELKNKGRFGFFKLFGGFIILTLFFFQKYFGIFKNGQKKCPKLKTPERLLRKTCFVTEMQNYHVVAKKIIFKLLLQIFYETSNFFLNGNKWKL